MFWDLSSAHNEKQIPLLAGALKTKPKSYFSFKKMKCKEGNGVLYLQELHFFCGLNELLLQFGGFLHRLPLTLLKPGAQL